MAMRMAEGSPSVMGGRAILEETIETLTKGKVNIKYLAPTESPEAARTVPIK